MRTTNSKAGANPWGSRSGLNSLHNSPSVLSWSTSDSHPAPLTPHPSPSLERGSGSRPVRGQGPVPLPSSKGAAKQGEKG